MTSSIADLPSNITEAAIAAQQRWVEMTATQLTCLEPADRELIINRLRSAAGRAGADWAKRFAGRVSGFALWSGFVFASVIGVAAWVAMIPSRHSAAALTAAAYLTILAVALPVCWSQTGRMLSQLNRISAEAPRKFLNLYLVVLVAAAVLYGTANRSAANATVGRNATHIYYLSEFIAFCVVTALGFLLAYLVMAYSYSSAFQGSPTNQSISWAEALAATIVTAWFPTMRRRSALIGNRRLDSGLLCLWGCIATLNQLGNEESLANPHTVRSVIATLEQAAADIQKYALSGVPRSDITTRRLARQNGIRMASVVRDAKAQVASALHPVDYTTVAITLCGFLLAWAKSEKNSLTATTSDASISPIPFWRRAVGRVWNAVILAAAATVLPLLPIYHNDQAAAAGLRYALFTAAVLALATGASASDSIEKNLEKTIPTAAGSGSPH